MVARRCIAAALTTIVLVACAGSPRETLEAPVGIPGSGAGVPTKTEPRGLELCPEGMVLVEGDYCPDAVVKCKTWVDAKGRASKEAIPDDGDSGRCGEFVFPTTCAGSKVHKRFCIDRYEYPNVKGQRPESWMTWYDVKAACESQGKRLCDRSEWTFACEGQDIHPLPYGDGYHRDRTSCNIDNEVPENPETGQKVHVMSVKSRESSDGRMLDQMLKPSGSMPACVSPFGVYDMVGNVDEFVVNPTGHHWRPKGQNGGKEDRGPFISGLMSGHVFGVRNACRPLTPGHNESFSWYETGGRCCGDAAKQPREKETGK